MFVALILRHPVELLGLLGFGLGTKCFSYGKEGGGGGMSQGTESNR